jgi:hypothetical protein
VYLTVGVEIRLGLLDTAVTVTAWFSPAPAVIPARLTVCKSAPSWIAGGLGIALSVGGSLTGPTTMLSLAVAEL